MKCLGLDKVQVILFSYMSVLGRGWGRGVWAYGMHKKAIVIAILFSQVKLGRFY